MKFALNLTIMSLAAILLCGTAIAAPTCKTSNPYTRCTEVEYCKVTKDFSGAALPTAQHVTLKMDIAYPNAAGSYPAIVFIHGGGWLKEYRQKFGGDINEAASRGYVAATISYRLSGGNVDPAEIRNNEYQVNAKAPRAVNDTRCAIRFLKAHAATYKINTARIGVHGRSAGGHLAMMLGAAGNAGTGPFAGTSLNNNAQYAQAYSGQSPVVKAVASWYGPSDLYDAQDNALDAVGKNAIASFLGASPTDFQLVNQHLLLTGSKVNLAKDMSPYRYINGTDPKMKAWHGDLDTTVPIQQSEWMDDKYDDVLAPDYFELVEVTGGRHNFGPAVNDMRMDEVYDFFDANL